MNAAGGGALPPATLPVACDTILVTDCGSTSTKAILVERRNGRFRLTARGEAPTTVEAPWEDVTRGVRNAIAEVAELSGRRLLDPDTGALLRPARDGQGVDLFLSTSSAGGGLQMLVVGVVRNMTAESAERAALGAGAIVMDVIAFNDPRRPHEQIERIRQLRPDMILLSGAVDGGSTSHVVKLAELVAAAEPRPRLGGAGELPVVYAGNVDAREAVATAFGGAVDLVMVDNLRPVLERENLLPAREKIHDVFLEHVMARAPGYLALMAMCDHPIMPTPAAVGEMVQSIAADGARDVLAVDIGGATTDVFSVFAGQFNRTVSANLGLSYSVANVLRCAGLDNVRRWVPIALEERDLRDRLLNKMIRPTTLPQLLSDLLVEQAAAREALRLAFAQHRAFATRRLMGVHRRRTIGDAFRQDDADESLVDLLHLDLLIGSGGVLSHAPRRAQAALMLVDAFLPEGLTRLAVDSIFMLPQLGVLNGIRPDAAREVLESDCLVPLGACLAPVGPALRAGSPLARVTLEPAHGPALEARVLAGELGLLPLARGVRARLRVEPARGFDVGRGAGTPLETDLDGGEVGLILDGRGRPLAWPAREGERLESLRRWHAALALYPEGEA